MHSLALLALATSALSSVLPQHPLAFVTEGDNYETPLPLLIWHGLGDNYQADGLHQVGELAEKANPGTYVYYIHLADDAGGDREATFLGNLADQVAQVCTAIAADPILATAPAVNALGFSQGGQFLRAYVERCNNPPVANLVTFGAQHNGIARFQDCSSNDWLCRGAQALLKGNAWTDFVQSRLVPAQYYRNPEEFDQYLEHSNFLADINNEREVKNETYKENMKKLEKFAMYVFEEDDTVHPKQSGWFSEFNSTSDKETKLQDRILYKEDWLGLRWLDERGRLDFVATPGKHMALNEDILNAVFKKYYARSSTASGVFVSQEF